MSFQGLSTLLQTALVLKEPLGWNHAIGFLLIAAGAGFVFSGRT